jgi:peroxiredoxin
MINLTMKKILIIIFLLFPILCFAKDKPNPQHIVKIGDQAPDFTLKYLDGKTQKLSELRGKVVMLQFTASWCSVCRKEMPHIEKEIWKKLQTRNDFVLAGIDLKENSETIQKFIKTMKISYPILLDTSGSIFELYAEKDAGVTRNIIIDKNGKIAFLTRLYDPKEFDAMKGKIKELLEN